MPLRSVRACASRRRRMKQALKHWTHTAATATQSTSSPRGRTPYERQAQFRSTARRGTTPLRSALRENSARRCMALISTLRKQRNKARFVREQPPLAFNAAAITRQAAVGSDDAMTRHDDSDRVVAVCETDRSGRARSVDALREPSIAFCPAKRDIAHRAPDRPLERRAAWRERQIERT